MNEYWLGPLTQILQGKSTAETASPSRYGHNGACIKLSAKAGLKMG
jgi:hypothetical protein